ncbi:MAG: TolC family outer membrane protein [Deinococcus-Thermus bacterium]|jgi:outer membrane protein/adhesin transport system outer membrane protein|nr:TolC family outer membrane protein [Deinococcota bacterium]
MRRARRDFRHAAGAFVLGLGLAFGLGAGPATAQTLEEALALAYDSNPTLAAQRAQLRATNEELPQALAGYRPTVTADGSVGRQWSETTGGLGAGDEAINPASIGIQVDQPIYRGGGTTADVARAENVIEAGRAGLVATEQQVLLAAATAYMDVVREQAVLDLAINNEQVLARQLQASRDRFAVGEITRTDVSQAESRLSGATADRIEAAGNLRAARATYERVIGLAPGTLVPPGQVPGLPTSLESSISQAETGNPQVIAAVFAERAAADGIDLARSALLPQITVSARAAVDWEPTSTIDRRESASVTARISVPLYQAGAASSRVREARHSANQARIQVDDERRAAIEQAIRAWEFLTTARATIDSLDAQVNAAEIALDGVRQEALVGSRTVLDVLDAEQELLDARVALVRSQRDEVVAGYQLLAAVGQLTARDLGLPVAYYDVEGDYRRTRSRVWGTSID